MAYNSKQKYLGLEEADPLDFDDLIEIITSKHEE